MLVDGEMSSNLQPDYGNRVRAGEGLRMDSRTVSNLFSSAHR